MAQFDSSTIRSSLTTLLPPRRIWKLARQYGVVQRQRKVDIVALVLSLTLGFASGKRRTLTAFRRSYEKSTGVRLAPSAFYGRFNRGLVRLVRDLVNEAFSKLSEHSGKTKGRVFRKFAEVLAIDSTLIRLHDALELAYPSIRPNQMRASAKLGIVMNVASRGAKSVKITYGRRNDLKTLSVGPWVKNRLLIFDRGYFKGMLFTLIGKHRGFFLCRMRENLNPLILRSHLPESRHFEGRMFKQARRCFISDIIDLDVEMHYEFRRGRPLRRSNRYGRFRIVGIWNEDSEQYRFYITNLPVNKMKAEQAAALYAVRWEAELLFRELKSQYRLTEIPSRNIHVSEALIYSALLCLAVSRRLHRAAIEALRLNADRCNFDRWSILFVNISQDLLDLLVSPKYYRTYQEKRLTEFIRFEIEDPNVCRKTLVQKARNGIMVGA